MIMRDSLFTRTVWYELLCGEWPHKGLPPEAIIWQVGRGMKPSLANLQASRDVKVIPIFDIQSLYTYGKSVLLCFS